MALAALALVVFGAYDSYPYYVLTCLERITTGFTFTASYYNFMPASSFDFTQAKNYGSRVGFFEGVEKKNSCDCRLIFLTDHERFVSHGIVMKESTICHVFW